MKLEAVDWKLAVAQRHNLFIISLSYDFEARRQRLGLDNQRVVAASFKARWQVSE